MSEQRLGSRSWTKVRKLPASPGQNLTKAIRSVCTHAGERGRTKESRLVAEASDQFGASRAPRIALVVTRGPPKNNRCQPCRKLFLNSQRLAWGGWQCAGGDATGPRGGGARARGGAVQVGGPGPGEEAGL